MTQLVLPTTSVKPLRRLLPWILAAAVLAALVTAAVWRLTVTAAAAAGGASVSGGQFYPVAPMDLEVKLVKDGELQAINNIEIVSEVEGQTTIQQIVKEGANVKKGDVLVVLDSSQIRQKIEDTTIDLQKAEADVTNARELRDIQESKNAADLEAAEVALTLAELDLRDYEEAAYPQQLANARTDLDMAAIDLKNRREDLAQTRNLFSKGFVTAADVKKSELEVTKAENAVAKAQTALTRLEEYTHASDLAAKRNALSQAEQRLARVKRENASQMSQKNADVAAKTQNQQIIKRRMERLQQQLASCTIAAPADGMVVFATSGDRNAQNLIQEGATVRERQTILRLPDTSSMKAVLRVAEQQVARLREGQRAKVRIVGVNDPVGATLSKISVLADSGQRWMNPDLKEYPVDLVLDTTPPNLRPQMGVQAEVLISRANQVLAVPLASIYSVGNKAFVFARAGGNDVRPVEVALGQVNDTHAEVRKGLAGGENVLILERGQGQQLLERAGIKIEPTTRPSGDFGPGGAGPGGGGRGMRNRGQGEGGGPPGGMMPGGAGPGGGGDGASGPMNGDRPRRNRDGGGMPGGGTPGSGPESQRSAAPAEGAARDGAAAATPAATPAPAQPAPARPTGGNGH